MTGVELRVDVLAFEGVAAADVPHVLAALEAELARLVTARGLPQPTAGGAVTAPAGGAEQLGAAAARAIHGGSA